MGSEGDGWRLGRRPALDGVRGLAIIMVILDHIALKGLAAAGSVGVTVFFTLSGFLITALLLEEHDATGTADLRAFYRRRALRLFPALVAFLGAMLVVWRVVGPGAATPLDVLLALSYFGNWFSAAGTDLHGLTHTWSLAVEEQFYLVWPCIFAILSRLRAVKRGVAWVAGTAAIVFCFIRFIEWSRGDGRWVYFATEARADALLVGCLVAAWLHGSVDRKASPRIANLAVLSMVPLFASASFGRAVLLPTIAPLLAAAVIVAVVRGSYSGWLTTPWLVYLGRRSYAMYLWNFPMLWIGPTLLEPLPKGVSTVLMLGASWGLTLLSWRYVESPFLHRKDRPSGPTATFPRISERAHHR
jgi:peptidoglycan/LPS O-acetylase OafA/YrhL